MTSPVFPIFMDDSQSLVRPEQAELPMDIELGRELFLPEPEQRKRFTAERVALNRERYLAIVSAIAEGIGLRRISRAFHVSHHTVRVILEREPELVATLKKRLARTFAYAAQLTVERCIELLEDDAVDEKGRPLIGPAHFSQLSVSAGIFEDKRGKLEGEASTVIEHRTGGASLDDMRRAAIEIESEISPSVAHSEANLLNPSVNQGCGTMGATLGATLDPQAEKCAELAEGSNGGEGGPSAGGPGRGATDSA
jgi:hypothetical protein